VRNYGLSFDDSFSFLINTYMNQINFIKRYFSDFSTLNINDRADFIIWDYIPPTPINSENFWGHYIYGILERSVRTVVNNGKVLLEDFQLRDVDEIKIHENIATQGTRLYNKFNG
ncbi:MAG: hypothetical protein R3250_06685, partial [Melioribacteraceae bacterium]|nr:hypothetical protein [Melioribacteraceae bacterium]